MTRQEKANEFLKYFKTGIRTSTEKKYVYTENEPEELNNLIHEAHRNKLPDDYTFEFIRDALNIICEYEEVSYIEGIDNNVDIYTSDLLQWLSSNLNRSYYLEDAINENGEDIDIIAMYCQAQFKEREEVFYSVLNSIDKLIE